MTVFSWLYCSDELMRRFSGHPCDKRLPGEGVPGVVHDAVKVIGLPQRVHLPRLHFEEVVLLAWGAITQVY